MNKAHLLTVTGFAVILSATPAAAQVSTGTPPPADPVPGQPAIPVPGSPATQSSIIDANNSEQTGGLGDIVVTAQRRSENLQNVPIAVTAVTGSQLARSNISNVLDLRNVVPSLNIVNSNNILQTSLRGIGSTAAAPGFENPVAIYVDGVYLGDQASAYLDFNNVSQVEVLKGPQGTLFGRNATGGLVQVTTRTPGQEFAAEGDISYGNYQTVTGNAYLAGPISSTLAADVAVRVVHQGDGFGTNLASGQSVYKVNHNVAVRSKWVFTPTDATKLTVIGDYSNSSDSLSPFSILAGTYSGFAPPPGTPGAFKAPDLGYDVRLDTPSFKHGWSADGSVRLDQKLGSISLASITAYRSSRYSVSFDYDGSTLTPGEQVSYTQPAHQFSQEFQLSSPSQGRLTYVAGLYYYNAVGRYSPVFLGLDDAGVQITIRNTQRTQSLAGYGQATYELFDQTHLTVGLRYTTEKREAVDGSTAVFVEPIALALPVVYAPNQSARFNKLTFRVSLDHRFSTEVLGYLSFNRGFKSGGFNTGTPGTVPYRPETIDAFEGGVKTDLLDRHLRLNIAGFYYNYSDIQSQFLTGGAITVINAASAHLYGADVDFQALITDRLRLSGGFSAISANYRSYPNAPLGSLLGGTPSGIGSAAGNRLPLAAKLTTNFGLNYTMPLAGGTIDYGATVYYNSGFYFEADNNIKQGRYAQLAFTAKWTDASKRFSLGVFGKNLNNERVISFETTNPNGTHVGEYTAPRTYGVTAGFKF